tara:strand:+ start:611 stop:793 length:183 start_codon:yes stop_codon:yes gene_type:complete
MTRAEDNWKKSHKNLSKIKDDLKDCTICGCPITKKDYDDYKMCPWCYSEVLLESDDGNIL